MTNCLDRLTVRCFYPLSEVNRLSVDRTFRSEAPGFGLVDVFKSLKGYTEQSKLTLINFFFFFFKPNFLLQIQGMDLQLKGV